MRYTGKTALVTGSTKGIGAQIARRLAGEGASVLVTGRSRGPGQGVVDDIRTAGGTAEFVAADLGEEQEVTALVSHAVDVFGSLDVLVNNAAPMDVMAEVERPITEITGDGFHSVMKVGFYGSVFAIKAAIPHMLQAGGGAIVNISSMAGVQAVAGLPAYASMKGAIQGLTRQVAADFGTRGIRSNGIICGPIRQEGISGAAAAHPLVVAAMKEVLLSRGGEMGTPDDVAEAVLYLASDAAGYVNGAMLAVDGGVTCRSPLPDISRIFAEASGAELHRDKGLVAGSTS